MASHKVLEVISKSPKSFDDAVQLAVSDAAKTVRGIKSIYVDSFKADVENDKIVGYRVNAKITFEVAEHK